jgi:hypothetical protein
LRALEYRVLGIIFGPKRRKWREVGEDYIMRSFITCTLYQILLGIIFWFEKLKRGHHLEYIGGDGR